MPRVIHVPAKRMCSMHLFRRCVSSPRQPSKIPVRGVAAAREQAGDVRTSVRFEALLKRRRLVDRLSEKTGEKPTAAYDECSLSHGVKFLRHPVLELHEAQWVAAENRQIDVGNERSFGTRLPIGAVVRRFHERCSAARERFVEPQGCRVSEKPIGASMLGVDRARLVNRIVIPERELHEIAAARSGQSVHLAQAVGKVFDIVVAARLSGVRRMKARKRFLRRSFRTVPFDELYEPRPQCSVVRSIARLFVVPHSKNALITRTDRFDHLAEVDPRQACRERVELDHPTRQLDRPVAKQKLPKDVFGERAVGGRADSDCDEIAVGDSRVGGAETLIVEPWSVHASMVVSIDWIYNQSMGRRSMRSQRRAELTRAFARVLATHGYSGATIARVADEAGVAPGLVHHHFAGKDDLLVSLLDMLLAEFRNRTRRRESEEQPLEAYVMAAVALDKDADAVAARCWVGVFAEALRDPAMFTRVRRLVDTELEAIGRRSRGALSEQGVGAVLAFVVGALLLGAFAPRKTAGFAAPSARKLVRALMTS